VALILGLFTRFAAGLVFFNMLAAILTVHAGHGLFAKNGGYEYPLLLLMTSVLFVVEGSRRYGIDASFWRAIHRRRETPVTSAPRPHYVG
jgi:putative oxidoreductase